MRAIRWSDNDRYLGPLTYAHEPHYRKLAIVLGSGDNDEYPGCRLRISIGAHTMIVALPAIIRPDRLWVDTSHYGWSKGACGYWDTHERSFGFSCSEGFLRVFRGRRTHDSSTDRTWGYFLPWTQWRHIRRSFYGLNGEHVATLPDTGKSYLADPDRRDRERAIEEAAPTAAFAFQDFDGEGLTATTRIEEREWRFGVRKFKWLSVFRKPRISRSLAITFSGETGRRKGSWKGGTIGHAIEMQPSELHEAAFRRYCAENGMTFQGAAVVESA